MKKNILIVGGGAIGGIMAARLTQKGIDVDLLVKYPELKKTAKNQGLKVTGFQGHYTKKVNAYLPSDLLSETYDIVMIATKANDMKEAALHILPFLEKESLVVSLQNGICEDELARIVGIDRTVGCVVGWGATMVKPGVYDMTSGGEFVIGAFEGVSMERLQYLKSILEKILPVKISDNIYSDLYSKLIVNSCISTLGAISGVRLGKMLKQKMHRNIFLEIVKEAMQVADAMKLKVVPYANKIDYYKLIQNGRGNNFRQHLLVRIIGLKYRRLKSSALQSLERGKKTETDWFNGYIVSKANEYDIDVPVNKKLVDLIKEIEKGTRQPGFHNFNDPFFKRFK
ncbi:MAG: ketopantoate reductase family protein [Bacteroidales bacterium]